MQAGSTLAAHGVAAGTWQAGHSERLSSGGYMKAVNIIPVLTAVLILASSWSAYAGNGRAYNETVALISKTMAEKTSAARKESYGPINIDRCILDYQVSGTYPGGTLYDIKFSDINFSSLNHDQSKTGHDYTDFILLNFGTPARYRLDAADRSVHTIVINTADAESAKTLFQAFLHLGELCGAFR